MSSFIRYVYIGRVSSILKSKNPRAKTYRKRLNEAGTVAERLEPIAQKIGCSIAQLALCWCAANDHVSTIILGATKMHQLEENIEAVKYIDKLTPSIMNEIEEAISNKPREDDVYKQVAAIRGARL